MGKRMRLPNGFGQISQLKGRRLRSPWRAMVTTGWSDDGKPQRMTIGYYKSYNEAYEALLAYHNHPYKAGSDITLEELYEMWSEGHYKRIKSTYHYVSAWRRCRPIYKEKIRNITRGMVKQIAEAEMPPTVHENVKLLLSLMFDYAISLDLLDINPVEKANIIFDRYEPQHHKSFSREETERLWELEGRTRDMIIFGIYTGFRPGEICAIKTEDIDLNANIIIGGFKTKSGTRRSVPIHNKIHGIVEYYMSLECESLFGLSYSRYKVVFDELIDNEGFNKDHKPHDTRVTFVTRMKEYHADEYAIKRIVGHKIDDITERVYSDRGIEFLKEEIEKMV